MLEAVYTKQFQKDMKLMLKRGKKLQKLKNIVCALLEKHKLEEKHRDHWLKGDYSNRKECHIDPDWLLIYKPEKKEIIFERTGTHSDLFR